MVITISKNAILAYIFAGEPFTSNLIEQYRGNQGLLILISIVFIAGILSLLKWKFRKTPTFYVQIFFIVVLPILIIVSPLFSIITEKIQLATANVEEVISLEEFSRSLDFTTLQSYEYDPESEVIAVSLKYNKKDILDWYKERMDADLVLYWLETHLSSDIYQTSNYIWSKTSTPNVVIKVYWDETLVHSIKVSPKKNVFTNYPYYPDGPFKVERIKDVLILHYEIEGKKEKLVIAEKLN